MGDAARELQNQSDAAETMQTAVEVAVREMDGADGAALSIILRGGKVQTLAASSDAAGRADELQYELEEGPCLEAVWEEALVRSRDFAAEERWPRWAARVAEETGYRSMMAFQLFTTGDAVGALNLYSTSAHGFDAADRELGLALAAHISVAVRQSQEIADLKCALDGRTVISQAVGMLMERYGLPPEGAFSVLTRVSTTTNTKLRDIAAELCAKGTLPGGATAHGSSHVSRAQ